MAIAREAKVQINYGCSIIRRKSSAIAIKLKICINIKYKGEEEEKKR